MDTEEIVYQYNPMHETKKEEDVKQHQTCFNKCFSIFYLFSKY